MFMGKTNLLANRFATSLASLKQSDICTYAWSRIWFMKFTTCFNFRLFVFSVFIILVTGFSWVAAKSCYILDIITILFSPLLWKLLLLQNLNSAKSTTLWSCCCHTAKLLLHKLNYVAWKKLLSILLIHISVICSMF